MKIVAEKNMTIQTWVQTLVLIGAIFWHYATMRKDIDMLSWKVAELEKRLDQATKQPTKP